MSPRVRPPRLRPGSKVAVVAPAGPVKPEQLERGVGILRDWGLSVDVGEHVLGRHPELPYLSAPDSHRAADFERAWCDPEIEAVLCARGGYGTLRMVDLLDWDRMRAAGPKVFAGSSDITVLHEAIGAQLGLVTLFAPMIGADHNFDEISQGFLRATLFEPETVLTLAGPNSAPINDGVATGVTVGGNLTLLSSTLGNGTAALPPDGSIVLLEDVNEEPYQVDRMLTQLLRAGWFTGATGIALGSWTGCGEPAEVTAVVTDLLAGLGVPLVRELGFGHCAAQLTVPLGVPATLNGDLGSLTLHEPALS